VEKKNENIFLFFHPLLRGVRRQTAGGMYKRGKNYELISSKKTDSSKIDFPKISRFREAGKISTPACGGNPEILEKSEAV
jgi:hypothetical protein